MKSRKIKISIVFEKWLAMAVSTRMSPYWSKKLIIIIKWIFKCIAEFSIQFSSKWAPYHVFFDKIWKITTFDHIRWSEVVIMTENWNFESGFKLSSQFGSNWHPCHLFLDKIWKWPLFTGHLGAFLGPFSLPSGTWRRFFAIYFSKPYAGLNFDMQINGTTWDDKKF